MAKGAPRGAKLTVLANDDFENSGSGYSLAIGFRYLEKRGHAGDVEFMDADLLYPRELLRPLLEPRERRQRRPRRTRHGRRRRGRQGPRSRGEGVASSRKKTQDRALPFHGECVGIGRLDPEGMRVVLDWMAEREKTTRDYEWEHALEGCAERSTFASRQVSRPSLDRDRHRRGPQEGRGHARPDRVRTGFANGSPWRALRVARS